MGSLDVKLEAKTAVLHLDVKLAAGKPGGYHARPRVRGEPVDTASFEKEREEARERAPHPGNARQRRQERCAGLSEGVGLRPDPCSGKDRPQSFSM